MGFCASLLPLTLASVPRRALLKTGAVAAAASLTGGVGGAARADDALPKTGGYVQFCDESVMSQKAHGTTAAAVQQNLRWNVDRQQSDRICSYNRHYAEYAGCKLSHAPLRTHPPAASIC
jgi:hypothetical protein